MRVSHGFRDIDDRIIDDIEMTLKDHQRSNMMAPPNSSNNSLQLCLPELFS